MRLLEPPTKEDRARHALSDRDNIEVSDLHSFLHRRFSTMAELAKQIIRQQWPKRHDPNPLARAQAISLIKTHVVMLRQWRHR
ncbi:MAG: hypothetical protein WD342_11160 [Verrucomicrobiales bacterium]